MSAIRRTVDGYFWVDSHGSLTSGTGHATKDRTKYPHMWTSDPDRATQFTLEEANVRVKHLKRYYGDTAETV